MEGFVGVGHVHAVVYKPSDQVAAGFLMAGRPEYFVFRLAPNVGPAPGPLERLELYLVVSQHAEGRDDVLFEVLVLVVSPYENKVGIKGVYLIPNLLKGLQDPFPVGLVGSDALIIAPFLTHLFRPVGWVFHLGGDSFVVLQHPGQRPGLVFIRDQTRWVVSRADS